MKKYRKELAPPNPKGQKTSILRSLKNVKTVKIVKIIFNKSLDYGILPYSWKEAGSR